MPGLVIHALGIPRREGKGEVEAIGMGLQPGKGWSGFKACLLNPTDAADE